MKTLVLRIADINPEPELKRIRVDLEPLPIATAAPAAITAVRPVPYSLRVFGNFAQANLRQIAFDRIHVASRVLTQTWRERDLRVLIGIQGWSRTSLIRAANTKPQPAEPIGIDPGVFAFREKLGFFGHNAPKWGSLPKTDSTRNDPYTKGWDKGDKVEVTSNDTLDRSRTIWSDSQGTPNSSTGPHAYLERPVSRLTRSSWLLFTSPELKPNVYSVYDARETSRADYGLSGRATALTLADQKGDKLTNISSETGFPFRDTTAHIDSHRLELAELPIDSPVADTNAIELDRMVLGLNIGQPIALSGERADNPGVEAAEIAFLSDVFHRQGHTTLVLRDKLKYAYLRDKLSINANTVHATHGETVHEILGSGDGSAANQRFTLKKPPLTYVSASTPRGVKSTLEVRANGVRWDEAPSLYAADPDRQVYVARLNDDAQVQVMFGDGVRGARLPSGAANVTATYRSGIGPDGEVAAGSLTLLRAMPLGLRAVANPLPASGGEGPGTAKRCASQCAADGADLRARGIYS